jgi:hypothetical protein
MATAHRRLRDGFCKAWRVHHRNVSVPDRVPTPYWDPRKKAGVRVAKRPKRPLLVSPLQRSTAGAVPKDRWVQNQSRHVPTGCARVRHVWGRQRASCDFPDSVPPASALQRGTAGGTEFPREWPSVCCSTPSQHSVAARASPCYNWTVCEGASARQAWAQLPLRKGHRNCPGKTPRPTGARPPVSNTVGRTAKRS